MCWATTNPVSGGCSAFNMGEKPRTDHCRPTVLVSGDAWRWKLSFVEVLEAPWHTEPHAPQRCVGHVELDADDYPGGDPQNGQ